MGLWTDQTASGASGVDSHVTASGSELMGQWWLQGLEQDGRAAGRAGHGRCVDGAVSSMVLILFHSGRKKECYTALTKQAGWVLPMAP